MNESSVSAEVPTAHVSSSSSSSRRRKEETASDRIETSSHLHQLTHAVASMTLSSSSSSSSSSSHVSPFAPKQNKLLLIWAHGSPYSWRVRIALEELKIPYESKVIDLPKKEHKSKEFLALNPRGQVPVLVDGDAVVFESLAIMHYLEMFHSGRELSDSIPEAPRRTGLLPSSKALAALAMTRAHEGVWIINLAKEGEPFYTPVENWDRSALMYHQKRTVQEYIKWDSYLDNQPYFAGPEFSLADIALFPLFAISVRAHFDFKHHKLFRLDDWYQRVASRVSVTSTFPAEWQGTSGWPIYRPALDMLHGGS